MSTHQTYSSYLAKCPFYMGEERQAIYCKGVIPGTNQRQSFPGSAKDYLDEFCRDIKCWQGCPVAQKLLEEEGDGF